jgi:hypothetical protein
MLLPVASTVSGDCAEAAMTKSKIKQVDQMIDLREEQTNIS